MSINLGLDIVTSAKEIEKMMLDIIKDELSKALQKSVEPIKKRLMDLCDGLIRFTSEYQSLVNGQLLADLGLTNAQSRLSEIINTIKNSLEVAYQPLTNRGGNLSGGLIISILQSDFADILNLPASSYVTSKGSTIPWLDWMLLQGSRIIVIGYDVFPAVTPSQVRSSRTGLAVMKKASGFRIEPGFDGVANDNFLTRAFNISSVEDLITDIVQYEVEKSI